MTPTTRRLFRAASPKTLSTRVTVLSVARADSNTSRQLAPTDEFLGIAGPTGASVVIPTPYDVGHLVRIIEQSNILPQCIDAYVTNTVGTGWEVGELVRGRKIVKNDRNELQSFIDHSNSDESLSSSMKLVLRDRESVGFGFIEVIRDVVGRIALFRHAPSLYTRLCVKHPDKIAVAYDIPRGQRISVVTEFRRFRRYVQIVGGRQRWFREFGDPRRMDFRNGAFEGESGFDPQYLATELYHFKNASNEPYGIPKWVNQMPNLIGSREAEEVNMRYFQDNTVPPMLLTVAGGRLTAQSYRELNRALNDDGVGKDRQNRIMLLEAVGEGDSLDGKGTPVQLKVDKLTDTRQSDSLFDGYDKGNQGKIRSSFRLPPITVGQSEDVNFATANVSAFVAESQVFAPERQAIDEVLNKQFVNGRSGLGLRSAKLVSRTPAITSPDMLVKTLTALNVMGAVTPRQAQKAANTILQMELEPYPEKGQAGYEEWMDKPIIFATRAGFDANGNRQPENTHGEQSLKDDEGKDVEETGNVAARQPKHGKE